MIYLVRDGNLREHSSGLDFVFRDVSVNLDPSCTMKNARLENVQMMYRGVHLSSIFFFLGRGLHLNGYVLSSLMTTASTNTQNKRHVFRLCV